LKILFLEPFYGGSHKEFALGFQKHSIHEVSLVTLPDRFWKWRMRGSACYFAGIIDDFSDYDVIFTTDMMHLPDLKSLAGDHIPPLLLYFHENQISYPLALNQKYDAGLGFSNIVSAVAADKILFNSHFHFNDFIRSALHAIKQMPDAKPQWMIEQIRQKTQIAYPGCWFEKGELEFKKKDTERRLIIWNHRWEHDKNFQFVFDVLCLLKERKIPFSIALLGERYNNYPDIFNKAKEMFKEEISLFGYLESKQEYISWLKRGAVVVSSAIQENFGISVVEAVRYGCIPLLPARLSYPELIPEDLHSRVLYRTKSEMSSKLENMLTAYQSYLPLQKRLSRHMEQFSWERVKHQYDAVLEDMVQN